MRIIINVSPPNAFGKDVEMLVITVACVNCRTHVFPTIHITKNVIVSFLVQNP